MIRPLRFRSIRTKLAALFGALFAAVLVAVALATQAIIVGHAKRDVHGQMAAVSAADERVWSLRGRMLASSIDVMARDFGFRAAVATGDRATVASALRNLGERAEADAVLLVDDDGGVAGSADSGSASGDLTRRLAATAEPGSGVVVAGGEAYRLVAAPVLAPDRIGTVVLADRIDAAELAALRSFAAVPVEVAPMARDGRGGWRALGGMETADDLLPRTVMRGGEEVVVAGHALPAPGGRAEVALLLSYPLDAALADYSPLRFAILAAGLAGLAIVIGGAWLLARGIARPILSLERAAQAVAGGDRRAVARLGVDEVGRLADSFNAMIVAVGEREDRIAHMAFNDALTGLPNRVLFREQLAVGLRQAAARGQEVGLLCVDLDGFKTINDMLGHPFGDRVLQHVARTLSELLPGDLVARLGGDEFAVIVHESAGAGAIEAKAQRIIAALGEPALLDGQQVMVGASIGVALGPIDGADADTLLKNADLSLYRAKSDGRGVLRFYEPALDAEAQQRRQMEIDLRTALAEGQFIVHYQPIFDSRHERIVCFEALLRWRHPQHGLIAPDKFIPLAEQSGLILRIGEWVLREACEQARHWSPDIRVAVNVSPMQFRNPGLNAAIVQALAHSRLAPGRLEIEITESIFLESTDATLDMLRTLHALGVRIALDDFGVGYSSLSYLRSFPFDKIKIDRSFVGSLDGGASGTAIIDAIVRLAGALGMETTAEGIETADQLDRVRAQGCTSFQGFLFSRPVSGAEANVLARGSVGMAMVA